MRLKRDFDIVKSSASTPSTVGLPSTHVTEWMRRRPNTFRFPIPCRTCTSSPSTSATATHPLVNDSVSLGHLQENDPSASILSSRISGSLEPFIEALSSALFGRPRSRSGLLPWSVVLPSCPTIDLRSIPGPEPIPISLLLHPGSLRLA